MAVCTHINDNSTPSTIGTFFSEARRLVFIMGLTPDHQVQHAHGRRLRTVPGQGQGLEVSMQTGWFIPWKIQFC